MAAAGADVGSVWYGRRREDSCDPTMSREGQGRECRSKGRATVVRKRIVGIGSLRFRGPRRQSEGVRRSRGDNGSHGGVGKLEIRFNCSPGSRDASGIVENLLDRTRAS